MSQPDYEREEAIGRVADRNRHPCGSGAKARARKFSAACSALPAEETCRQYARMSGDPVTNNFYGVYNHLGVRYAGRGPCFAALTGSVARGEDALTVLVDGDPASPAVLLAMESEADAALAPSGITLAWRLGHDLDGGAVNGWLALIQLRGRRRPGGSIPHIFSSSSSLGRTFDAIRKLTDRDLRAALPAIETSYSAGLSAG